MLFLRKWRSIWLIHAGILLTFALIPVWYRLPQSPIFARLYVTRFLIFLPMVWSICWWVILGAPGLRNLARSRWRAGWALALLLLALWGFASLLWAFQRVDYPDVGATAALQFGVSALFAVVVACAAPRPRAIVTVLILCLIGNAAITVLQAQNQASLGLTGLGEFSFSPTQPGVSILESGSLRWVRPYGLLPHPNLLAGSLLVGVLATGSWMLARRWWLRAAGVLIFGFGFWALLMTFSRAAWGGLVVGGLAAVPFLISYAFPQHINLNIGVPWKRRLAINRTLGAVGGLATVIALVYGFTYAPLLAARVGEGQESVELRSVSDRLVFMDFAFRSIRERPILGVGIGNFPWRTSYYLVETNFDLRGDNVHNVLLSVTAELGVVGLALALAAIICGAVAVIAVLRAGGDDHPARLALFAVFVALLAVGFLDHYPWTQIHFQAAWWGCLAAAFPRDSSKA